MIHGGIDGYSRIPVYLKCSSDNEVSRLPICILRSTEEFGLSSIARFRSDRIWGENVNIAWHMLIHTSRGPNKGIMIVGKSVHNQQIQRLWRDVYC